MAHYIDAYVGETHGALDPSSTSELNLVVPSPGNIGDFLIAIKQSGLSDGIAADPTDRWQRVQAGTGSWIYMREVRAGDPDNYNFFSVSGAPDNLNPGPMQLLQFSKLTLPANLREVDGYFDHMTEWGQWKKNGVGHSGDDWLVGDDPTHIYYGGNPDPPIVACDQAIAVVRVPSDLEGSVVFDPSYTEENSWVVPAGYGFAGATVHILFKPSGVTAPFTVTTAPHSDAGGPELDVMSPFLRTLHIPQTNLPDLQGRKVNFRSLPYELRTRMLGDNRG